MRVLGWRVVKFRSGLYTLGLSVLDLVVLGLGLDFFGSFGFVVLNFFFVCFMGFGVCFELGGGWTVFVVG